MSRHIATTLLVLVVCAGTVPASAQATSAEPGISTPPASPVAYIYVSTSTGQIEAYAAGPDGSLTAVPGSPLAANAQAMALTRTWLFGAYFGSVSSYSIASNGAISLAGTVAVEGDEVVNLFLDHTGTWLYVNDYDGAYNNYLSYNIDKTTGQLTFLNQAPGGPINDRVLSFLGNNEFAYTSTCADDFPQLYGVQRASDGSISELSFGAPLPAIGWGNHYCPWFAAADPTDHLVIAMQPMSDNGNVTGPYQLATYTADSLGNLTTNSTFQNMPRVLVGSVSDYWMSPNGNYLAVAGFGGLQVFRFRGASPLTKYTGLLTGDAVWQVFWDNASHLYALSTLASHLYVFTVTSKGVWQAPGSPYAIDGAQYLIVLPK